MKGKIFGISGHKGVGKDTVANMLLYIIDNGTAATYDNWERTRLHTDIPITEWDKKGRITHFADPLKDVLSSLFNIPREYFDDRLHKDLSLYCCDTGKFMCRLDCDRAGYTFVGKASMENYGLEYLLLTDRKCFYIRDLMQYFGTSLVRNTLGSGVWVKSTGLRIKEILTNNDICLIPDVRFYNEAELIHARNGKILHIHGGNNTDKHESETVDFKCDCYIENNGTLMNLYYQVLNIYNEEIKWK